MQDEERTEILLLVEKKQQTVMKNSRLQCIFSLHSLESLSKEDKRHYCYFYRERLQLLLAVQDFCLFLLFFKVVRD